MPDGGAPETMVLPEAAREQAKADYRTLSSVGKRAAMKSFTTNLVTRLSEQSANPTSNFFGEGKPLPKVEEANPLLATATKDYEAEDPQSQSDILKQRLTFIKVLAETPTQNPSDNEKQLIEDCKDANLLLKEDIAGEVIRIQKSDTSESFPLSSWEEKLNAATTPEERAQLEAQAIWQFVPDQPTPGSETAPIETEPRSVDQIIQDEITRLQTKLSESKDLPKDEMGRIKNQLKKIMVVSMADGPAGMAFKLDALRNSDANLTDTEISQNNDLSKANSTNLAAVMTALDKLDPKMAERIKDYPDAGQAIANETNLVLEKSYKDVIKMIFGEDTDKKNIRQLRSVMDPNNYALMEKYAKGSAIGAVLLILLMGTAAAQQAKII